MTDALTLFDDVLPPETPVESRLLQVRTVYAEPAAAVSPRGRQVLARFPGAERPDGTSGTTTRMVFAFTVDGVDVDLQGSLSYSGHQRLMVSCGFQRSDDRLALTQRRDRLPRAKFQTAASAASSTY